MNMFCGYKMEPLIQNQPIFCENKIPLWLNLKLTSSWIINKNKELTSQVISQMSKKQYNLLKFHFVSIRLPL